MVMLDFSLSHEGCARFHDALSCLAKFGEYVTIVANSTQFVLTALNTSKSAYVSFVFTRDNFFLQYDFSPASETRNERFACSMLNRAMSSVFKGRLIDPRQKDVALDRCEVSVQERPDRAESRFQIKMIYIHGVTKSYRLTYESVEPMHALFDRKSASNRWKIQARLLREYIEYFAPKTEQLDIHAEDGRCTLLSFTEKITRGKETLKQPLETAVSIDCSNFQEFEAADGMHVVISVRDFKNMVIHAETLKTTVEALYSQPGRPLQFSYSASGIKCEFTFMTIGEAPNEATSTVTRESQAREDHSTRNHSFQSTLSQMAPPPRPIARARTENTQRLGSRTESTSFQSGASIDPDSLFLPNDEDHRWEPLHRQEEDEMLGWDASGDNNDTSFVRGFRDTPPKQAPGDASEGDGEYAIAPTQRVSQYRGLFD